ncbi:hypothetical protein KP509_14G031900 [Ceratopteris richardii]|uniref:YqgE/AlgH family protein n=1 Tax=Ceratopteris richardii TaxID=49495 RepID=A0A8T2T6U1_CERRI|nr:hypothetical protein KP509_14G031900 [Ceratopteris richardii]
MIEAAVHLHTYRKMEAVLPAHDPWCSLNQPRSSIAYVCLQSGRKAWRSCSTPTLSVPLQNKSWHASIARSEVGYSSETRFHALFNGKFPHSSGARNGDGETSSDEEELDKVLDTTPAVRNEDSHGNKDAGEDDWRAFRARLIACEQTENTVSDYQDQKDSPRPFDKKWAHPIPFPETGCLLVATDKLDGHNPFERSVILLLRLGSPKPRDGPLGVILNRPVLQMRKGTDPLPERILQMLHNCRLFYGGPLSADIVLMMQTVEGVDHLEEIMPGVFYGYTDVHKLVSDLATDDNFRYFVGYTGWDFNQLKDEIDRGFWWVAACSPDLLREVQSGALWKEVLTAMGGEYADISRNWQGDKQ